MFCKMCAHHFKDSDGDIYCNQANCHEGIEFTALPIYEAAPDMYEALKEVMAWWEVHQYDTTGDYGEYNLYDIEPDFVTTAREILERIEGKEE